MTSRLHTALPATSQRRHEQTLHTVQRRQSAKPHTVTVGVAPYADDPLFEDEIVTATTVLRATVDVVNGGQLYSVLTMEPESGALRQMWMLMDRDRWAELRSICDGAIAAINGHEAGRAS